MLNLLGLLTATSLIGVIVLEFLEASDVWIRIARVGLFVAGIAWIFFLLAHTLDRSIFLLFIPILYLVGAGMWAYSTILRRKEEDRDLTETHGWRCLACGTPNAGVNAVCHRCQAPRPDK